VATDFPTKDEDKKVSLRNSNYPQFDYNFIAGVKENDPDIYKAGGNIRGNEAFNLWTKARDGEETEGVIKWIKEREAWAARHFNDGSQFKDGSKAGRPSNIAGVIAQMKWGVIGTLGEQKMKDVVLEAIKYTEQKESGSASQAQQDRQVTDEVEKGLKKKVEDHNEEVGNVASKRTTYRTLLAVFKRGIGAYKTNPASVRPNVASPEQWAYARVNSFLFALRNGRFQGGKHDLDLLPESHPLSSKEEKAMDEISNRHILNVDETDESVIIEFAKHHKEEDAEDMEERPNDPEKDDMEERPYHDEDKEDKDKKDRFIDDSVRFRTLSLDDRSYIDEEKRTVRVGVSSESPVERSFGMEILGHSPDEIDMSFMQSGTAPFLKDHDMTSQIGVIERFELDQKAKRTVALVRFGRSALAEEVFRDIQDGIRMNISVGYKINKLDRMEDEEDGKRFFRASWMPMEVSSVSLPADSSLQVGVGRSKNLTYEVNMENQKPEIDVAEVRSQTVDEARKEFAKNSKEILDLAAKHNKRDLGHQAISEGKSIEEFRGVLLETISNDQPLETPVEDIGLTEKETKRFSILRAVNAMANPTDRKAQEAAKFEFECSEAAQRQYGQTAQGVLLPGEVLRTWQQRDMNASDDSGLIGQDFRGGDFIDALRNNSAVMPLATMLTGLSGDVKIPKKSSGSTAAFISSEGGASGESEMTIGSVSMSPKTAGVHTDVTRQLLIQSSLDVENLIRNDLAQSMAILIDDKALEGSGSSGNPTGITNTSGINTVSLSSAAAPTFAEMVSMETAVRVDNALLGDLAYIIHPTNYGTLKTTEKATNTAQFVAVNDQINGYQAVVSPQLTANNYVFGNFNDLLIGMFGSLDILVDPFSNSSSGTIRIVALQSVDVAVRHAVSFCAAS
jgi:Caudovirus prohead protease.|tara:strand:+ start:4693 stop:7401 length:2709 start_codon:yes stop_codon:yes gene_type:complete